MRLSDLFISFNVDNTYAHHSVPSDRPDPWCDKKNWVVQVLVFIVSTMLETEDDTEQKSGVTAFDSVDQQSPEDGMEMYLHTFLDYETDEGTEHLYRTGGKVNFTLNRADSTDLEWVCSNLNGAAVYSYVLSNQGKTILLCEWSKMLHQELTQYRSEYSDAMIREIQKTLTMIRAAIKSLE